MSLAADSISRRDKAAADTPLVDRVSRLQLLRRVLGSDLLHGLEELRIVIHNLGAALALRVASADRVPGAAVPVEAAAARGVAFVLAHEIARAVSSDGARGGIVAEGRGHGCVGEECSEEFAGEMHLWILDVGLVNVGLLLSEGVHTCGDWYQDWFK